MIDAIIKPYLPKNAIKEISSLDSNIEGNVVIPGDIRVYRFVEDEEGNNNTILQFGDQVPDIYPISWRFELEKTLDGKIWSPNLEGYSGFGRTVAISGNGNIIATADKERGDSEDPEKDYKGRVEIFEKDGGEWMHKDKPIVGDKKKTFLGQDITINKDGTRIAVSSRVEKNGFIVTNRRGVVQVYEISD